MKNLEKSELLFYFLFVFSLVLIIGIWYVLAFMNKGVL
jgi:hypothetical protein